MIFLHHNTNISGLAVRKKLKLDSCSLPKHELVVEECLKSVCTQMLLRRSVALIQCDEDMQDRRNSIFRNFVTCLLIDYYQLKNNSTMKLLFRDKACTIPKLFQFV